MTPHPAARANVLAQIEQIERQFAAEWNLDRKAREWPPQGSPLRRDEELIFQPQPLCCNNLEIDDEPANCP